MLSAESDVEVIAEATDCRTAMRKAEEHEPDVVLMGLTLPHTDSSKTIKAIKNQHSDIKIIALTAHRTEESVLATLEAGADGYVLKEDNTAELISAVNAVRRGKSYLSSAVTGKILTSDKDDNRQQPTALPSWESLTPRELQVLKLVAAYHRNREIAEVLSLSPKTVEKHRGSLMKKLDLHSCSEVTQYAIQNGLASG